KIESMKKISILLLIILMGFISIRAQIAINTDGSAADNSAMLDIKSTTKGVLLPRMTNTQIQSIASPADGLLVYSTDDSKVYCYNSSDNEWKGIDYGSGTITPFVCGTSTINDSDGNTYNTVLIGSQCWMAENLNVGTRIDGVNNPTNDGTIEKYCYNDDNANCTVYGGLYQWDEMMQYATTQGVQGICPDGWHLPTDAELTSLIQFLGGVSVAGGKMKEISTTHWNSPNTSATNESGFTALPAGYCYSGSFSNQGKYNYIWSSTEESGSGTDSWLRHLYYNGGYVNRYNPIKTYGFSVRCLLN
ncbi:MAG: FISUMP domain-containing protein, partial [Bacteroidota bacterium]